LTFNGIRLSRYCLTATGAAVAGSLSSAQASQVHTVKTGDNLSSIARKYHITAQDIIQANHLTDRDVLSLGKKLIIPEAPKPVVASASMHSAATIHGDRISVRIGPSVAARRVDLFDMGTPVTVTASQNNWFQVTMADGRDGWVRSDYIKLSAHEATRSNPNLAALSVKLHASAHSCLTIIDAGKVVGSSSHTHGAIHPSKRVVKLKHVSNHHGVASAAHEFHLRHLGRNHFASASHAPHRVNRADRNESTNLSSSDLVRTAVAYRGTPYHYGGTGRGGFDCSGFTSYVYRKKGVSLPHNAAAQFSHGTKVDKSNLEPGDLVFFHCGRRGISHVGIFVGNGKFVHASSPHSGGVRVDSLNAGYYKSTFRGARRVKK
jgi:cell wall-associated NlpC family hydrolase